MEMWRRAWQYLSDLMDWVGVGRVVATIGGVAIVAGGAWWVMRTPPYPIESKIPFAMSTLAFESENSSARATVTSTIPLTIMVHVAGEVMIPGIVVIDGDSRVIDALSAAGGPTTRADLNSVNLAAPLVDAAQIYIPRRGEVRKPTLAPPLPGVHLPSTPGTDSTSSSASALPIDLNTATELQLVALPGIGPATANAIVTYRLQHGPFARIEDLLNVRGIGPSKLEALLGLVRV